MREDEIEALLKFDGAQLLVVYRDDLMGQAGAPYTAIVKDKSVNFSRGGKTRIEAVRAAWDVYRRYRMESPENQKSGGWIFENAMGDVDVELKKLLEEKRNEKSN